MDVRTLDSFNAKYLDADKFKKTFVPSPAFDVVAKNGPVLVVGPRGSGKTTLLKMLGNEILPYWNHKNSCNYKENIKFEGVYVPADSVWADRIRALKNSGISEEVSELFASCAFSTNVYLCAIEAIARSFSLEIKKNPSLGEKIAESLDYAICMIADFLQIDLDRNSFLSLKYGLKARMKFLGEYAKRKSIFGELNVSDLEKDIEFIYMDLDETLEVIFDCYDKIFNRSGVRWAILLDEFEVAPESLQRDIMNKLRSSSKKHIYKIALVPCGKHLEGNNSASSKNDYDVLQLWSRGFDQNKQFCKDILESRFGIRDPESVFGTSDYVEAKRIPSEDIVKSLNELVSKDPGFKDYIDNKGIKVEEVLSDSPRGDELRKIAPEIIFRNSFKDSNGKTKRKESLPGFYAGWQSIVKISEGNPRWIMSTITSLYETLNEREINCIPKDLQARQITNTTSAFKSMIATTALEDNMGITTNISPISLINKLADFIRQETVKGNFKSDPYGHFMIDRNVDEDLKSTLQIAFNHGAIVSLEKGNNVDIWDYKDLDGHRFRLSYLFSPVYKLPVRLGKKLNLSLALLDTMPEKSKVGNSKDPQIGLAFDDE